MYIPPAGCVRDRVPVDMFLSNVCDIVLKTDVIVNIVVFNDIKRNSDVTDVDRIKKGFSAM